MIDRETLLKTDEYYIDTNLETITSIQKKKSLYFYNVEIFFFVCIEKILIDLWVTKKPFFIVSFF